MATTHLASPLTSGICPLPNPPAPNAAKGFGAAPADPSAANGLPLKAAAGLGIAGNLEPEDSQGWKSTVRS